MAVRLNVICNYRIVNPEKLVRQVEGAASQIYTCVQLKLREYVGSCLLYTSCVLFIVGKVEHAPLQGVALAADFKKDWFRGFLHGLKTE